MKKLISLFITLVLVFSMSTVAFATDDNQEAFREISSSQKFSESVERLETTFSDMNQKFPGANLNVSEALSLEAELSTKSSAEKAATIKAIFDAGPIETFTKTEADGSVSTLKVYQRSVKEYCSKTLGTSTPHAGYITYTGTRVFVENTIGISNLNMWYYVDHDYYESGSGTILNAYSPGSSFGNEYSIIHWRFWYAGYPDFIGADAAIRAEVDCWDILINEWVFNFDSELWFNANTLTARFVIL